MIENTQANDLNERAQALLTQNPDLAGDLQESIKDTKPEYEEIARNYEGAKDWWQMIGVKDRRDAQSLLAEVTRIANRKRFS